jgi:acyl carrier protein
MAPRKKAGLLRDQGVTELWSGVGEAERLGREFPWALKKVKRVVCEGGVEELKQMGEGLRGEVLERVYGSYGSSEVGGSQVQWKVKGLEEMGGGVGMRMEELRAGARMYLLDAGLEPVPEGVVGELYVGGGNAGLGYEGNGGRTGWSYVPDKLGGEEGGRLYRTGDLWWRRRDGSLEYVGRKDGRVQLGGRRVEAGEVEYWLKQHEGLKEAVVTVRGEVAGQEEEMAVWAVSVEGAGVVSAEVREYLRKKMGGERAPEQIRMVEQVPRKESGEIDVEGLGRLLRGGEAEYVAARNEMEERLAGIWKEILGVERVGVKDNFFQIGGHSLLATQVVARMSSMFGVEIELRRLFESPTISGLAVIVESLIQQQQQGVGKAEAAAPIRRVARQSVLLPR